MNVTPTSLYNSYPLQDHIRDKPKEMMRMEKKDDFLTGAKVTKDNQIYGTLIARAKMVPVTHQMIM